eukprot:359863-Chlamydomonas_euryale.AAC.2
MPCQRPHPNSAHTTKSPTQPRPHHHNRAAKLCCRRGQQGARRRRRRQRQRRGRRGRKLDSGDGPLLGRRARVGDPSHQAAGGLGGLSCAPLGAGGHRQRQRRQRRRVRRLIDAHVRVGNGGAARRAAVAAAKLREIHRHQLLPRAERDDAAGAHDEHAVTLGQVLALVRDQHARGALHGTRRAQAKARPGVEVWMYWRWCVTSTAGCGSVDVCAEGENTGNGGVVLLIRSVDAPGFYLCVVWNVRNVLLLAAAAALLLPPMRGSATRWQPVLQGGTPKTVRTTNNRRSSHNTSSSRGTQQHQKSHSNRASEQQSNSSSNSNRTTATEQQSNSNIATVTVVPCTAAHIHQPEDGLLEERPSNTRVHCAEGIVKELHIRAAAHQAGRQAAQQAGRTRAGEGKAAPSHLRGNGHTAAGQAMDTRQGSWQWTHDREAAKDE